MKALTLALTTLIVSTLSLRAAAKTTHVDELTLECGGEYEVLSASPYYIPPKGRAPGRSGTAEKVVVLSLEGEGCETLNDFFGITLQKGDEVPYGKSLHEGSLAEAKALAQSRIGKTFPFQVTQHFGFQTQHGYLPLFPTVHSESAELLGISGTADVAALYGTPAVADLSESQIVKLLDEAYAAIEYGKKYTEPSSGSDDFLNFILSVNLKEEAAVKEYLEDLLLLFSNLGRHQSSFVTLHPGTLIGKKINELFNLHKQSKFHTQLNALKRYPLLIEGQIIGWAFLEKQKSVPQLSEEALVELLEHFLEQAQNLANVPQVIEARYLLSQYKGAANVILAYSPAQPPAQYPHPKYFAVGTKAEALIELILAVK